MVDYNALDHVGGVTKLIKFIRFFILVFVEVEKFFLAVFEVGFLLVCERPLDLLLQDPFEEVGLDHPVGILVNWNNAYLELFETALSDHDLVVIFAAVSGLKHFDKCQLCLSDLIGALKHILRLLTLKFQLALCNQTLICVVLVRPLLRVNINFVVSRKGY